MVHLGGYFMSNAKWCTTGVAIASMLTLLAGCGGNASTSQNASGTGTKTSTNNKSVTLTWFMWSGSEAETKKWQQLAADVTKKYPNIHVKLQTASWADYWTKLQTEMASDTLPDIISLQSLRTPGFGSAFLPLDDYIKKDPSIQIDDFNQSILKALQYQGKQVALPYDFGPEMIFYNKTLFKKHHVPFPSTNWTWSEFQKDVKELSSDGDYGFVNNGVPDSWLPFVLSNGGDYLTSDGKYDFTNSKLEDTVQTLADFTKNHQAPQMVSTNDSNWTVEQWESGKVAMVVDGPWDIINYTQTVKFPFGVAPIPSGSNGSTSVTAGSGFGISKDCKDPEAAFKAISVITSTDSLKILGQAGRAYPARESARDSYYHGPTTQFKSALSYAVDHSQWYRITDTWNQANDIISKAMIPIFNGQTPVKEGMQQIQDQLTNLQQ